MFNVLSLFSPIIYKAKQKGSLSRARARLALVCVLERERERERERSEFDGTSHRHKQSRSDQWNGMEWKIPFRFLFVCLFGLLTPSPFGIVSSAEFFRAELLISSVRLGSNGPDQIWFKALDFRF